MACDRVQFSKKPHGDNASFQGAGIVRKPHFNRKRISTGMPSKNFREIPSESCGNKTVCEGRRIRDRSKLRNECDWRLAGFTGLKLSELLLEKFALTRNRKLRNIAR